MEGSPHIPIEAVKPCSRCHHDLSALPPAAHFCPGCGQKQIEVPLATIDSTFFAAPLPAPEYFHSVVVIGYVRAMNSLGDRYESGRGVARNIDEALRCYCKAARLGNSEARLRLIDRGVVSSTTSPDAPSNPPSLPVATEPQTP